MDGLDNSAEVIVVGATNRYELLDDALIRPGRFSYKIAIELPEKEERKEIFKHYFKLFDADFFNENDLEIFAKETKFFSGADIEGIVNEVVSFSISISLSDMNKSINKDKVLEIIKVHAKNKYDHKIYKFNEFDDK
jgi:SpoVK/Ycf46/Vps4 family AAA+-type ATPase